MKPMGISLVIGCFLSLSVLRAAPVKNGIHPGANISSSGKSLVSLVSGEYRLAEDILRARGMDPAEIRTILTRMNPAQIDRLAREVATPEAGGGLTKPWQAGVIYICVVAVLVIAVAAAASK